MTADDVARLTLLAQLTGAALASQPSARTVVLPAPAARTPSSPSLPAVTAPTPHPHHVVP